MENCHATIFHVNLTYGLADRSHNRHPGGRPHAFWQIRRCAERPERHRSRCRRGSSGDQKIQVRAENIDHVIFGNALQTSADAIYLARHIGLRAGIPQSTPALTLNRLCGSGFQTMICAAQMLLLGDAEFVLAGGTESMSQAPHVIRNARWGIALGEEGKIEDSLWSALTDGYCGLSMAHTAEKLAAKYGVARKEADEFAYQSQMRTKLALESGRLGQEIVPIDSALQRDEHPRPETTSEGLGALKPIFKKDGVVTAGNASGICDGAAAVILTTEENAEKYQLKGAVKVDPGGSPDASRA